MKLTPHPPMRKWLKIAILATFIITTITAIYADVTTKTGHILALIIGIVVVTLSLISTYTLLHPTTLDMERKKMIILASSWLVWQIAQGFLINNGFQTLGKSSPAVWTLTIIFATVGLIFKIIHPSKIKESTRALPIPSSKYVLPIFGAILLLINTAINYQGLFPTAGSTKSSIFSIIIAITTAGSIFILTKKKKFGPKSKLLAIAMLITSVIFSTKYTYRGFTNMWLPNSLDPSWATLWTGLLIIPILTIIIKFSKVKVNIFQE